MMHIIWKVFFRNFTCILNIICSNYMYIYIKHHRELWSWWGGAIIIMAGEMEAQNYTHKKAQEICDFMLSFLKTLMRIWIKQMIKYLITFIFQWKKLFESSD